VKILLIDDHPIVRRGVRELLAEAFDAEFAEAESGAAALRLAVAESWDLAILDLGMPGLHGLDVLRQLRDRRPTVPIVILSGHTDEEYAVRALRAGASGYVTKEAAADELVLAVRKAIEGGTYVCSAMAQRIALLLSQPNRARHATLSARELQVLRMIGAGKTVKQIGLELGLSDKTISTYRARLLEKMQLETTAELMRYALHMGLVD
jgi:DNA-binding NarL/FixJ family response regulator